MPSSQLVALDRGVLPTVSLLSLHRFILGIASTSSSKYKKPSSNVNPHTNSAPYYVSWEGRKEQAGPAPEAEHRSLLVSRIGNQISITLG